jgi:hypothetical protein
VDLHCARRHHDSGRHLWLRPPFGGVGFTSADSSYLSINFPAASPK